MKIGQAIDLMVEDKTKEYEDDEFKLLCLDKDIAAFRKNDGAIFRDVLQEDLLWRNWELVRPAVSFMDACNSEKMFKVKHQLIEKSAYLLNFNLSSFVFYLNKNRHDAIEIRKILRDGEFFIV